VYRTFEELGVSIDGIAYGRFSGEVQFDPEGAASIDIDRSQSKGPPLHLNLDELLAERARLRKEHGDAMLADYPGVEVRSHRRRFELFWALAETLDTLFADDVVEYFLQARWDAKAEILDRQIRG
jgi:hypothetical protein